MYSVLKSEMNSCTRLQGLQSVCLQSVTAANSWMQVVKSWDEPSSPVSHITGTPMYMAFQVLQGSNHTPNTALESLLYTILSVCTEGHPSGRDADFYWNPVAAAMERLGFMLQPPLEALQHVSNNKRDCGSPA